MRNIDFNTVSCKKCAVVPKKQPSKIYKNGATMPIILNFTQNRTF